MNLSKRLSEIVRMVSPCDVAADIGCDHGFTAISLIELKKAHHVIASDINEGPLLRAKEHVKSYHMENQISLVLSNGLKNIETPLNTIIIAGMGGMLIRDILLSEKEKTLHADELILSPHTDQKIVRETLQELSFEIVEESMVYELGKYYVMIRAKKSSDVSKLSEADLSFGPILSVNKPEVFLSYLEKEKEKLLEIKEKLEKTGESEGVKDALLKVTKDLSMIDFIMKC